MTCVSYVVFTENPFTGIASHGQEIWERKFKCVIFFPQRQVSSYFRIANLDERQVGAWTHPGACRISLNSVRPGPETPWHCGEKDPPSCCVHIYTGHLHLKCRSRQICQHADKIQCRGVRYADTTVAVEYASECILTLDFVISINSELFMKSAPRYRRPVCRSQMRLAMGKQQCVQWLRIITEHTKLNHIPRSRTSWMISAHGLKHRKTSATQTPPNE